MPAYPNRRLTVVAKLDGDALRFDSDGDETTRTPTDDVATGVKELAAEQDCLTVLPGEGYCRD